jgi:hypothetical protein
MGNLLGAIDDIEVTAPDLERLARTPWPIA